MRVVIAIVMAVAGVAIGSGLEAAAAAAKAPSAAQIRSAVRRAEHSHQLWSTVNICNSKKYPDYIGVRGQMPSLGFPASLSMRVQLYYYSQSKKRYVPVPSSGSQLVTLGRSKSGLQQGGALFQFSPHQPTLTATVKFIWRRSGHLLGETQRGTTAGHHHADYASPPHYSAATCKIS